MGWDLDNIRRISIWDDSGRTAWRWILHGIDLDMGIAIYLTFMVREMIEPDIENKTLISSRTLAYQFLWTLPWTNTVLPIITPTLYLWIVDTIALRRGTWVIESGTKLGWQIWRGLEIEYVKSSSSTWRKADSTDREAIFFLVTNMLIVFGLVAFDNAMAILNSFPVLFPTVPRLPSPALLVTALLTPTTKYDQQRLDSFLDALKTLRRKSRSFYLASGVFEGRLRNDLILLYSFCRTADDLVDTASSEKQAHMFISKLRQFLDASYSRKGHLPLEKVIASLPESARLALQQLPTQYISPEPLYSLLEGFEMDLEFPKSFPIRDQEALELYGTRVAGTVAELIIELVYYHSSSQTTLAKQRQIIQAGNTMGVALQLVNIARDIQVDAKINRVYIPTSWLKEVNLSPKDIIKNPNRQEVHALRRKLLDHAMDLYHESKPKIEMLPSEARSSMRVAVESYMEIGRVLQKPGYKIKAGRATVPTFRRILVAWKALCV